MCCCLLATVPPFLTECGGRLRCVAANGIGDDGAASLAAALKKKHTLATLNVASEYELRMVIACCHRLQRVVPTFFVFCFFFVVVVADNLIGAAGAAALGAALKKNHTLTELSLGGECL